MVITSFSFLAFVLAGSILYYLFPKKYQWFWLLLLSLSFYIFAAVPYTIIYLIVSAIIAYISTLVNIKLQEQCGGSSKAAFYITIAAISVNTLIWFVIKGRGLWLATIEKILSRTYDSIAGFQMVAALGMGYYTLQVIGYIIDCYWQNVVPQKNFLKLFLFVSFFPQLITGPISRYSQLESLYEGHSFSYKRITMGAQRILWGFLKKLVLAERVGILVSTINASSADYYGVYSWIAILLYPLQMYADFSGCCDIVIGVAEIFGITLPENFNNPFFSKSSQEFWQRWHITLGTFAKDYVLFTFLNTTVIKKLSKTLKKRLGKKTGKFIISLMGMFLLWLVMGIWHGGLRFIVGVSLWYWIVLMLGELTGPMLNRINVMLNIKTESLSWHIFQSARTYLIYAVGATFFSLGVTRGLALLSDAVKFLFVREYMNLWALFDGTILFLGLSYGDINLIIICVFMLLIVAILREKYGYARLFIEKQGFVFRWIIWLGLFAIVLVYGMYGPGYSASEFIYQGF